MNSFLEELRAAIDKAKSANADMAAAQKIAEYGANPQAAQAKEEEAAKFCEALLTNPPASRPHQVGTESAQEPVKPDGSLPFAGLVNPVRSYHDLVEVSPSAQFDLGVMKALSGPLKGLPLAALRRLRTETIPRLARLDAQYLVGSFTVGDLKSLIKAVELSGRSALDQTSRRIAEAATKEIELDLSPHEQSLSAAFAYHPALALAASGDIGHMDRLIFELEKVERKQKALEGGTMPLVKDATQTVSTGTCNPPEQQGTAGTISPVEPGGAPPDEIGEGEPEAESKQRPWDEEDPDYISNSEAITRFTDNKMTLSKLSSLCQSAGPFRYMRKGQRCRVHMGDFHKYIASRFPTEDVKAKIANDYHADIELRKARERGKAPGADGKK